MDIMDEIIVSQYMNLNQTITKLKKRLKCVRWVFYQQTMTTHLEYTELGVVTHGFRPDREIEKLCDQIGHIEKQIDRNTFRRDHFEAFLNEEIPKYDVKRIKLKYIAGVIEIIVDNFLMSRLLEEIQEIETAVCFRENIEPDSEPLELTEDLAMNVDILSEVFTL